MSLPLFDIIKVEDVDAQSPGLILVSSPLYNKDLSRELSKEVIQKNLEN